MFCPKCSQQQSDTARFCSRCGFPLTGVGELLARGGQLPQQPVAASEPRGVSPRRHGMKQGGGIMLIAVFLIPALAIIQELIHLNGDWPLLGVLVFLGGLLRLLFAVFFEDGTPRPTNATQQTYAPPQQLGAAHQDYLPPAPGTPTYAYRPPPVHTAEMPRPPSVTEHTTRLLERQEGEEQDER
jgi:zinc-ribbon domain